MRVLTRAVLAGFLAWSGGQALAQQPALGTSLHFNHITIEDGLAQNSVAAVLQDNKGYIWIGTQDGLHKYDGYRFKIYRHESDNPDSLAENDIDALCADPDGGIWIGTYNGGLDHLDADGRHFTHYRHKTGDKTSLTSDLIWAVMRDSRGDVWVGTDDGLNLLDVATGTVRRFYKPQAKDAKAKGDATTGLSDNVVWTLYEDSTGRVWIGSNMGLDYYDPGSGQIVRYTVPKDAPHYKDVSALLERTSINIIRETSDGSLWVGAEGGLVELDAQRKVRHVYWHDPKKPESLSSSLIRGIVQDSAGSIWVGTYGGGVSRLDRTTQTFTNYLHDPSDPSSLGGDKVDSLYLDSAGLLWVGTDSAGVSTFDPTTRAFAHYRRNPAAKASLPSNVVWSLYEDHAGLIWAATDSGLASLDRSRGQYVVYPLKAKRKKGKSTVTATPSYVTGTRDGTLWVGTDRGLYERPVGTKTFIHHDLSLAKEWAPLADVVNVIVEDSQDRLWLGTGRGLILYQRKDGKYQRFVHDDKDPSSLVNDMVLSLREAPQGKLWVGTDSGLCLFDPARKKCRNFVHENDNPDSLSHNSVMSMWPAADGGVWLGTAAGLDHLATGTWKFQHYTVADGLPNNSIYGILPDNAGNLWLSTNKGLSKFDPRKKTFRNYDVTDGLQSDEFNAGADFRSDRGELFFGGINGFNAFIPADIRNNPHRPRVAITRMLEFNHEVEFGKPLDQLENVTLPYFDNVFSLEFAAFDYSAPEKNRFQYMLEGFDENWRDAGMRNRVTYTNLDPGTYVFRVKGSNNDGVWSTQDARLRIIVLPPPWRTWWAYLIYIALASLLAAAALRMHNHRIRNRHALESEQQRRRWAETLHQLTQALASSLDPQDIAEQLMDSLHRMMAYDRAALYVEKGVDLDLVATRGFSDAEVTRLRLLPDSHAQLFAELRHSKESRNVADDKAGELVGDRGAGEGPGKYLAVPIFSRSEEFGLLVLGRPEAPFSEQEMDIASAFAKQAIVALDNARLFAELQNLATTDGLTRLHNRRYFFELAELEFNRSRRYDRDLSAILVDADHFKQINDTYGHELGDRVLKILANTCRNNLRHFDLIGRYGGEEFVIVLPETPSAVAADVAERLRRSVESLRIPTHKTELRITISIGLATTTPDTGDLMSLINSADRALYEAKRRGRNQLVISGSAEDSSAD